jgi:putative ABC transport system permease protein
MLLWTILKTALKSLLAHKLRSFLAMLGIIIGVGAVIAVLALGAGARQQVLARISAMGTDLLVVRPGQSGSRGVMSGTQQNLTIEDGRAILREVPGVRQFAPVVRGNLQIKYLSKNTRTSVIGTTVPYFEIRNFELDRGRTFTELEAERMTRVAILGSATARDLFGDNDPLGEVIKIKGISFRVLGVLKSKGDQGWFNPDDQAIIPCSTAMKQLLGLTYVQEIDLHADDTTDLSGVQEQATEVLRKRHRLQPGAPDDFNVRNQAEILETASSAAESFTTLLAGIAFISLLVGGIGIMNIMLVTVTERTREIGIRKAIGAKDRDILRQFLIEAVALSGVGGLLGVAAGTGVARFIPDLTQFPSASVEPSSILLALVFSASVGIFFGFYPAWRAAMLNPIEALRYE